MLDSALSGDSLTLRDLGALLSREAQRGKDTAPHPNLNIYGEVTYLMPLNRAKEVLGLAKRINSKNKMACSGFPASSLYHYSFTGQYEGGYSQLYIVTDKADQVVCIQLVSEHPRSDIPSVKYGDWHVYDFVNARHKSSTALKIGYSIKSSTPSRTSTSTKFNSKTGTRTVTVTKGVKTGATEGASELLNIDIVLRAEDDRCLQTVRWYLPTPLAGLILECIEKQTSAAK